MSQEETLTGKELVEGEQPDHLTRCGGEPTNPTFYGVESEAELAAEDGYCRGCPDCEPEQVEDRWPVVWLKREPDADLPYGGWHLSHPDPLGAEPYDEGLPYYPASSPNVLSKADAALIARFEISVGQFDQEEWQRASQLRDRLSAWAEEGS